MTEQWKDIPGYPGYQASNLGRIRSHDKVTSSRRYNERHWKDRIIKPKVSQKDNCGRVSLWVNGKCQDILVHRLIATTFLEPLIDTEMTVNHKDGNRQNNNVANLEWLTRSDNIRHGFENGLYSSVMKKCVLVDEHGDTEEFESLSEASRFLSRTEGYVSHAIRKNKTVLDRITGKTYMPQMKGE